jgi:hypothetical protein
MIFLRAKAIVLAGILPCALSACSQKAGPLPPLATDQIVPEFQKAFAQAKPVVKEMADKVVTEVQAKDFPMAYTDVQLISNSQDATKAQKLLAVRATQAIYQSLTTAQAQGDQRSAAAVEMIKKYK